MALPQISTSSSVDGLILPLPGKILRWGKRLLQNDREIRTLPEKTFQNIKPVAD
jgi:hypothetical protein